MKLSSPLIAGTCNRAKITYCMRKLVHSLVGVIIQNANIIINFPTIASCTRMQKQSIVGVSVFFCSNADLFLYVCCLLFVLNRRFS